MAYTPTALIPSAQLANAVASVGGPTGVAHWLVQRAVFTNTDTAAHAITVYRVPNGGTAGTANLVIDALVLGPAGQPGHTYVAPELAGMVLNPSETIQAFADSANKVNIMASGLTF